MPSLSPDPSHPRSLAGQVVVFTGKLSSLGRKDARALVTRLGGTTGDDVNAKTTMLVIGAEGFGPTPEGERSTAPISGSEGSNARDVPAVSEAPVASDEPAASRAPSRDGSRSPHRSNKLKRAQEINAQQGDPILIITEDEFCRMTGVPTPESLKRQYYAMRDLLARYRALREDHLRYLVKCGVIRAVHRTNADTFFAFPDLAAIKEANAELDRGGSFRAIARTLIAARHGQLAFDFRLDAAPAKILALRRPSVRLAVPPAHALPLAARDTAIAEEFFSAASALDDGNEGTLEEAAAAYRKALEYDPYLVAAIINLANIHYSRDELAEAQALYERAIGLESDFFEAHFNLGNIYHDLGRFNEAQACYRESLRLNPFYADAHFYLAVTFEKMGMSPDALPHWRAYRQLAPQGEWVELAREFSE
ncbi:MAG TPA: tetratricopeptide repeat protein [Vicinamibacterales bacterium]|nr:tetratricopeptide repeat protein [Vicinamibacterales bacterium]